VCSCVLCVVASRTHVCCGVCPFYYVAVLRRLDVLVFHYVAVLRHFRGLFMQRSAVLHACLPNSIAAAAAAAAAVRCSLLACLRLGEVAAYVTHCIRCLRKFLVELRALLCISLDPRQCTCRTSHPYLRCLARLCVAQQQHTKPVRTVAKQ
jgi:succinate dehydrogenase/fumarate reductase cytochrome b subunit